MQREKPPHHTPPRTAPAARRLLIVDDEREQHELLDDFLTRQGYAVQSAFDATAAIGAIRGNRPDMVVMDVRMPGMDGLEALRAIREFEPDLPVLLITAFADVRDAVRAMKDGAVDYIQKPIDLDELAIAIADAIGPPTADEGQPAALERPALPPGVVAESAAMRAVFDQCALVARSDVTVMVTGESGTGKEVLTDCIHGWSRRAEGPVVKVNCAAIPHELLESELFGHEAGAFTGAVKAKPGRFEAASGGTVLLDEIAEMTLPLQAKLLRTLEDHTVVRLGSNKPLHVDFRLICATNKDLRAAVDEGRFREDLFFRISVIDIHIPPLRERGEDIFPLAAHFARTFAQDRVRISPMAQQSLEAYDWPGNVRELRNEIERACLMCRGNVILPEHLSPRILRQVHEAERGGGVKAATTLAEVEKATIIKVLQSCGGNRTKAAKELGISRRALVYKLRGYEAGGDRPAM